MSELCGRCGRGMAAVSPDGDVWPCVMSRWLPAGNELTEGLGQVLAGPRWQAVLAGIPAPRAGGPDDDDDNCNPKQDGERMQADGDSRVRPEIRGGQRLADGLGTTRP